MAYRQRTKKFKKDERLFGEFKCDKCGRSWNSTYSWEGKGQQCKKCKKNVLPHTQKPLKNPEDEEPLKYFEDEGWDEESDEDWGEIWDDEDWDEGWDEEQDEDEIDPKKPHLQHLCEKCKELGNFCGNPSRRRFRPY